tara:strand:- start:1601 stop:4108 length:2508 start_codon:yes stop_codon:yes gene_type:complete
MALTQWQLNTVTTDTIASGDFVAFSDEGETGDPVNKLTVDNLMETGLSLVTEDVIAVATDYILFLDGGATGSANKEQFADVMTAVAGTGISASSGVLNVDASQSQITTVGALGAGSIGTGFGTINNASTITGTVITATTNFAGALTGEVTGNAATVTTNANLTGDVTSSGNATTIAAGVIIDNDVNASAAIAYSKLAALASGNILVGNGSNVAVSVNPSGDVDISNTGAFSIASGVIINDDVNASAAIAYSKLAALADGNILVGNGSNVAVSVNPSGDVDISNAGVFTVANDAVTLAKMAGIARGKIIYGDASGNPAVLASGDAGEVLTMTDGNDFDWAAAGGGGSHDFVATGAIANGAHVALNVDGTVSVIAAVTKTTVSLEPGSGNANLTTGYDACFDDTVNKVVVSYKDNANSNYGYVAVGTVASGAITFATPQVFISASLGDYTSCTFGRYDASDSSTGRVIITYRNNSSSGKGYAIVGTVAADSTMTFGSQVELDSTEAPHAFQGVWDSDSDRVVIAWQHHANDSAANRRGKSRVGTVSASGSSATISFGTTVDFESGQASLGGMCFDSLRNKIIISYVDVADSNKGKVIIGTVSNTAISYGTPVVFSAATTSARACAYDTNSNKVVVMFSETGLKAIVGTVGGSGTDYTTITFGTAVRVDYSTTSNGDVDIVFDPDTNKMYITYNSSSQGTYSVGTVSGTSTTWSFPALFHSEVAVKNSLVYDTNSNLIVNSWFRSDQHYPAARSMVLNSATIDNYSHWVGIASAAISNGATGAINMQGSVNDGQSGLLIGYKYYVSDLAVVSTTYKANREVGVAVSASELLITQGGIS